MLALFPGPGHSDSFPNTAAKRMLILLRFDKDFATTTIRNEQVILHQRVISGILWQLRDFVKRESIERFIFCAGDEISPELPIPDLQMLWISKTGMRSILAVEVGFSQPSDKLESVVKDLIRHTLFGLLWR
ncbi:hypothetical protein MferCBS31731_002108 [Microsporum ferrugineum]